MSKLVCFLSGVVAGAVALGASYLVSEYAAGRDIERDNSDDGCLSSSMDAATRPLETENSAAV